jgi:hypothetical protein
MVDERDDWELPLVDLIDKPWPTIEQAIEDGIPSEVAARHQRERLEITVLLRERVRENRN